MKKIKIKEIITVIFLSVAFLYRINTEKVEWYFEFVMSSPVIFLGVKSIITKSYNSTVSYKIFKWATFPYIIAFVYSIFLSLFGYCDISTLTRGFSLTVQYLYIILLATSLISMFGKNTIFVLLKSCILSYIYTLVMAFRGIGFAGVFSYLTNPVLSQNAAWFEMHDIGLSIGLFLVYFLCLQNKNAENRWRWTIISTMILILSFKRVAILALVITVLVSLFVKRRESKNQKSFLNIITIVILISCFLYTYLISSGLFDEILSGFNVKVLGRDSFYSYFKDFYQWSLLYFGKGVGFVTKKLSWSAINESHGLTRLYGVMALHNDILKTYIEIGFIGSFLWFYYVLRRMTVKVKAYFGFFTERAYCLLLVYAFITYTTDNTMNYFVFQMAFFVILATIGMREHSSNRLEVNP